MSETYTAKYTENVEIHPVEGTSTVEPDEAVLFQNGWVEARWHAEDIGTLTIPPHAIGSINADDGSDDHPGTDGGGRIDL